MIIFICIKEKFESQKNKIIYLPVNIKKLFYAMIKYVSIAKTLLRKIQIIFCVCIKIYKIMSIGKLH